MRLVLIFLLLTFLFQSKAQTKFITENEKFIGWQPNVSFDFSDYQAKRDSNFLELIERFDYSTITNIQIYAFLDIPRKKSQRKKKLEQVYIAPVFCKHCSYAIEEDTTELRQDQIYFMIAEYAARVGRKNFDSLRIKIPGTGIYSIMFMRLRNDMLDHMHEMYSDYSTDVLIKKKEGAYNEWKQFLTEELKKHERYATKPQDCHRIITGEPILENYILAPRVVGDSKGRKY